MTFITEQLSLNELMFTGCPRKPNENKSYLIKLRNREGEGGREGGVGISLACSQTLHIITKKGWSLAMQE